MVKAKDMTMWAILTIVLVVVVGGGVAWLLGGIPSGGLAVIGGGAPAPAVSGVGCPTSGVTALAATVRNALNDSGREEYDNSVLLYQVLGTEETLFTTGSDTTSGAYNLDCGNAYRMKLLSASGSNAKIIGIDAGVGAKLGPNGEYVEFSATAATYNLIIAAAQHGVLEFRAFDVDNNAYVYDTSDAVNTNYETTGVTFDSSTDNATALTVGAGGDFTWKFDVRTTEVQDDVDFSDFSAYVLVDAATDKWNIPSLNFDGKSLSQVTLDDFESRLWKGTYEYAFGVDSAFTHKAKTLEFAIQALSGVDPGSSDDIVLTFASKGASRETSGNKVRYSGATDAASPAALFTVQTMTINVA